jgi:hypothetical protein
VAAKDRVMTELPGRRIAEETSPVGGAAKLQRLLRSWKKAQSVGACEVDPATAFPNPGLRSAVNRRGVG